MKRILICIAVLTLTVVSCKNRKIDTKISIVGSWELNDIQTKSAMLGDQTVSVYLDFTDTDFTIFQMIGEGRFRKFTGSYTITGDILDGQYSDGNKLGASYKVSLSGDTMILESASEIDTYTKAEIPSNIRAIN